MAVRDQCMRPGYRSVRETRSRYGLLPLASPLRPYAFRRCDQSVHLTLHDPAQVGGYYVVCNPSSDSDITNKCDLSSGSLRFNGDDIIALAKVRGIGFLDKPAHTIKHFVELPFCSISKNPCVENGYRLYSTVSRSLKAIAWPNERVESRLSFGHALAFSDLDGVE